MKFGMLRMNAKDFRSRFAMTISAEQNADQARFVLAESIVVRNPHALAEDDPLQKAVKYLFTGRNDPQDAPEILDRKPCVGRLVLRGI
jgi:hypothetical protein